ncbi:CLUMA_CG019615, isoform A [Clunio marinus]|uniref:CLUMA_CG019615, isoform A n=1 Tax=Clunio marinus TaxID=568069 RepID=A0A1J1J4X5_9DIPT|nr:CLUMA_CG019615, isoform A [Clunio marinus]
MGPSSEINKSNGDVNIGDGSSTNATKKTLTIIHYNDVYNIDQQVKSEPVGGAARFCTAVNSFKHLNPLVLFSGDAFNPSMLSTFTQGEQMIPVLNSVGTHVAVFGNHEFDFGLDVLQNLVKMCNFPWLMSNVIDNETGRPLGNGKITHIINHGEFRVGLMGLVEKEWLETIPTIDPNEVTFIDYIEAGNRLANDLIKEGCDVIIALTHMRTPNDLNLATHCPKLDLILGGHDHVYEIVKINHLNMIKSGTDFRQFSRITLKKSTNEADKSDLEVDIDKIDVTSTYPEDQTLKEELKKYTEMIESKMGLVLGNFSCELDGRFSQIRTSETNIGNWICDIVLAATGSDAVMINSGTFRSDQIHEAGPFTMKDLVSIIPMQDPIIIIEVSGKTLYEAIENGVSAYPKLEGRFPQVAGITFTFNPEKPPGSRVEPRLVRIGDEWLDFSETYTLSVKAYMHGGCDGYTMFKNCPIVMDEDACPELGLAIQNHFKAIDLKMGKCGQHQTKHRQSLVTLSRRHSMVQMLDNLDLDGPCPLRLHHPPSHPPSQPLTATSKMLRRASLDDLEQSSCLLAPTIQHRIIRIQNDDHLRQLLLRREANEKMTEVIKEENETSPQSYKAVIAVSDSLRKFLLQYPALFLVDGNYVHVNCFQPRTNEEQGNGDGKKDYIQEAKDYFSHKLLQYGAGTEVPIKSLLGHRSQASPQVRHISGQHIKEFTDFLSKHPDTFHVEDDHVVLVNYDSATVIPQSEQLHLPQPSIDVKFTKEILDFFANCIGIKGPTLVDQLFHLVTSNFPQDLWYRIFKTPSDLTTFLKLYSDCFHIQSNLVTLLQKPKISEIHIQNAEKVIYRNQLNQNQNSTPVVGDFKLNEPVSNNMIMNNNNHGKNFKSELPYNDDSLSNGRNSNTDMPSMGFVHSFNEMKLENLCAKNCPTKITYPDHTPSYGGENQTPVPSPTPITSTSSSSATSKNERDRDRRLNLTLKQRISNLVTKTLAENEEKDKKLPNQQQQHQQQHNFNGGSISSSNSSSTATSPIHRSHFQGDTWKIKILQNTQVISNVKQSQFVCNAIMKSATVDEVVVISFDCKGVNLGLKGQLTLIEIGTLRGEAFIFDIQQCPEMVIDGGLKMLLEDPNVVKVIHDCRNGSYNLYTQYDILLRNVFDTQSAHSVLQFQETRKQVYKIKNVSLNTLCELYNAPINPMKDQLKSANKRDQRYWAKRPLTRDMLLYAASDVLVMINEQLFRTMANAIKPENMNLFSELCTEQIYMLIRPSDVKMKKKQRKINTEVFDLKQKLQSSNKNVVLSNREIRLLRYLDLTEEEKDKLKGSVKVAKKLEKLENLGQDRNFSDSDDEVENIEQDYASIDSVPSDNSLSGLPSLNAFSPKSSEPPSLLESMHMIDELINNKSMEKAVKLDKLEALLSVAVSLPSDQIGTENVIDDGLIMKDIRSSSNRSSTNDMTKANNKINNIKSASNNNFNNINNNVLSSQTLEGKKEIACQTLSTGDIVMMKVFFEEDKQNSDNILMSSGKRDK